MEKHAILGKDSFIICLRWDNIENHRKQWESKSYDEQLRVNDRLGQQWIHDAKILVKYDNNGARLDRSVSARHSTIKASLAAEWYAFLLSSDSVDQTAVSSIFKAIQLNARVAVN